MAVERRLMTADELIRLPRGRERHELVLGVLRTMPLRMVPESIAATAFGASLHEYVRDRRLGKSLVGAGFTLTVDPDTVRGPAVSFISAERVSATPLGPGYWPGVPDLAVEVISPSDLYVDVDDKVADWLEHGTRLVFVVNPWRHAVGVHRSDGTVLTLTEHDELDTGTWCRAGRCPCASCSPSSDLSSGGKVRRAAYSGDVVR